MASQNSNFAQHLIFLTCIMGKPSYLAGLLEDQMKSYINTSIIHSIIDIIIVLQLLSQNRECSLARSAVIPVSSGFQAVAP